VLDHVTAVRYVTPLREGGSMPGVVEGSDLGTYVVKFRGAGQGLKVLVAEVIVGELARRLDLPVPRMVTIDLPPAIARYEADEEVQDLLNASPGTNLGVDLLPGSLGYDGSRPPDAALASRIVWLDALTANVDRTWSNPNLLTWHRQTWLIDHGAALYFHHDWSNYMDRSRTPFPLIRQHTLLEFAADLPAADQEAKTLLTPERLRAVVDLIPTHWLGDEPGFDSSSEHREAYLSYLLSRLDASSVFVDEAIYARSQLV